MPGLFATNIGRVRSIIWPQVREELALHRKAGVRSNRIVVEEVLWVLAKNGLLVSPAQERLQEALEAYYEEYEVENEDSAVYNALLALKVEQRELARQAADSAERKRSERDALLS